jgi:3-methyladenine DNA glycosylase AlkD
MAEVPRFLEHVERATRTLADMVHHGLRIDDDSIERLAMAQAHRNRWTRRALFTAALVLLAIAVWLLAALR